jgi:vitamin B12 transporter
MKNYCQYLFICLLTTLICGISSKVFAQTDTLHNMQEVKVIAVKKQIPLSIQQHKEKSSFIKSNAYNVADAIRDFAGVNIKDYGGIGGLKTVSVRSLGANHTSVLYDGVAISDAQNGQIDLGKLMLDNIESISLYSAQPDDLPQTARAYAASSVIAIKTIQPSFDSLKATKLKLGLSTGSFGLINSVVQFQQKIAQNWSYIFNTSLQKANGKYQYKVDNDGSDTLSTRTNADITALQMDASIYGSFKNSNSLIIRGNYYQSERGLPGAAIAYNPSTHQRLWDKDFYVQSAYKFQLSDKFKFLINNKISQDFNYYLDPDYQNSEKKLDLQYTQQEFYQSIASNYQFNKNISFNYSADLAINNLESNQKLFSYPTRTTVLQVLGSVFNYNKIHFNLNILNTNISEKVKSGMPPPERSVWSPTALFSYQLNNQIALRGFYKNIFRNPTFNDLYYSDLGKRDLKPEYVNQFDLGTTFSKSFLDGKLTHISFQADVYYNSVTNKIIAVPNKDLFLWTITNVGKANIYGLDYVSNLSYKLNKKWNILFSGNYTFQLALNADKQSNTYNNQLPFTPNHTFSTNLGFCNQRWGFYYNQLFSSSRYYLTDNYADTFVKGFYVGDLSSTYDFKIGKQIITTSFALNNIFNQSYAFIRSYPMPGTNTRISIKTTL